MFEASSLTADSIEKDSYTSIAANSAFNLRFGTAPYQWYAGNPKHAKRFAAAMKGLVKRKCKHAKNKMVGKTLCIAILTYATQLQSIEITQKSGTVSIGPSSETRR